MYKPEEWAEIRLFRPERITGSRVVCPTPCYLSSVVIASDGVGEADGQIWNGHGLGDELLFPLYCVDEAIYALVFSMPVYFNKGLYVVVGTNCESITVCYRGM